MLFSSDLYNLLLLVSSSALLFAFFGKKLGIISRSGFLSGVVFFVIAPTLNIISAYVAFKNTPYILYFLLVLIIILQILVYIIWKYDLYIRIAKRDILRLSVLVLIPILIALTSAYFIFSQNKEFKQSLAAFSISNSDAETLSSTSITESYDRIHNQYSKIDSMLKKELTRIQVKYDVIENVKNIEDIILDLKAEEKILKGQIKHYNSLLQVKKIESDALLKELNKFNFRDHLVGFLLGFFASLLATLTTDSNFRKVIFGKKKNPKTNSIKESISVLNAPQ